MQLSWLISAGAIAFSGYVFSSYAHENVAERVNGDNPGQIAIVYSQRSPGLGKLASVACAVGVGFSLWKGLQDEAPATPVVPVQQALPIQQQAKIFAPPAATQAVQYSDEPELEVDGSSNRQNIDYPVFAPSPTVAPVASTPVNSAPNIFERIYNNHKRHIFIPSETGGGKTTLLLGAIEYIWNLTDKNAEFYGSTAKESPWLGLEHQKAGDGLSKIITLDRTNPETIDLLLQRLHWLQKKLKARQAERTKAEQEGRRVNFRRVYVILDEWLQTLAIAKECDRVRNLAKEKGEPRSDAFNELIALVESFVLLGREDEICVWLFGQDHQVQNAKVNTGLRKNFGFIVPARAGGMMGLEDALTGQSPITTRTQGQKLFAEAEQLVAVNPETAICYSNIFGHELLVVPYLPDIKRKRIFGEDKPKTENKLIQFPKAVGFEQPELEDYWS